MVGDGVRGGNNDHGEHVSLLPAPVAACSSHPPTPITHRLSINTSIVQETRRPAFQISGCVSGGVALLSFPAAQPSHSASLPSLHFAFATHFQPRAARTRNIFLEKPSENAKASPSERRRRRSSSAFLLEIWSNELRRDCSATSSKKET